MSHSYEEVRSVALDILAKREKTDHEPEQYESLKLGVAEVFARREGSGRTDRRANLDQVDGELFLEVFWDLFRQGIITLGLNDNNREFPFFRVSGFGKNLLGNQSGYFFHDVASYEKIVQAEIPAIEATTLLYVKEAMQAFRSGCLLSAAVMLGVATEHTFELLLECIDANAAWSKTFAKSLKERMLLSRISEFQKALEPLKGSLPAEIKEDLDTQFAGILSIVRTFRNQSGHPSGRFVSREQTFVLLQLFITYCKKLYALMGHFRGK